MRPTRHLLAGPGGACSPQGPRLGPAQQPRCFGAFAASAAPRRLPSASSGASARAPPPQPRHRCNTVCSAASHPSRCLSAAAASLLVLSSSWAPSATAAASLGSSSSSSSSALQSQAPTSAMPAPQQPATACAVGAYDLAAAAAAGPAPELSTSPPQLPPPAASSDPAADIAGLFGGDEAEPIDPFTLYGTNFKKFVIEKLSGEKVVSRSKGFTVDTCVSAVPAAEETPEFQGLPTGAKVQAGNNLLCKRSTGPDLKAACTSSCGQACAQALSAYEAQMQSESGYVLEPAQRERVLKNCRRSCTYECTKSGKAHDFVVPYRR